MFLGEFTKTRRAFELTLVVITYAALNGAEWFMFMGTGPDATPVQAAGYLIAGLGMGVAAIARRITSVIE
jgi:hypothetical protein